MIADPGVLAERRGGRPLRPQHELRHCPAGQEKLYLEGMRRADIGAHQIVKLSELLRARHERGKGLIARRLDPDPEGALDVPDTAAAERVEAEPRVQAVRQAGARQAGLGLGLQHQPAPDELLDRDRQAEEVLEQALEPAGVARAMRVMAAIVDHRFVGHRHPPGNARQAEPDERAERHGEVVRHVLEQPPALPGEGVAVLGPGPVEERDQPVIEEVEEPSERGVARPPAPDDEIGEVIRERAHRPGEAHEAHRHLIGREPRLPVLGNTGGLERRHRRAGEAERGRRAEPHHLLARLTVEPDAVRGAVRSQHALEQADGLEELEFLRVLLQRLDQRSVWAPARGGHRLRIPSVPATVATV